MTILTTLFVILLCVALYHHIGYPLLLKCVSTKKVKPVKPTQYDENTLPNIAILMCAYNEQAHIAEKLHNLASLVYDTNHYTIHVYFDGCTDKSYQQALKAQQVLHKQGVKCFFHFRDENQGKVQGLNTLMGVAKYHNDILLFTDVSALLSIDALDKVAQQFSDPKVAISTGVYTLDENAPDAQKAYWQYQNKVKQSESNLGAVIGVPGAMFAMRAEYACELEKNTINDDFVLSMKALSKGGKAIVDEEVVIYERECDEQSEDYKRRVRVGAGNWQQIKALLLLLNPRLGWTCLNFFSHKVLRGVMPVILAGIYACVFLEALVSQSLWSELIATAILSLHTVQAIKTLFEIKKRIPIVDKVNYILNSYFLALWGIIRYEQGYFNNPWQRVKTASKKPTKSIIKIIKRSLDITGALFALSLVWPVCLIAALAIKLTSKGPIIFKQLRVGESSDDFVELFYVYKFRSMVVDAESRSGAVWASKDDPRITAVGRFMRKTRIDELPQLINVLKGEMSLIGPRPERPVFYGKLEKDIPYFCQRTYGVKPGISGLAQVMNGYDETIDDARSKIGWDYAYSLSMSSPRAWAKLEFSIVLKTLQVVFTGKGQ
ncbi:sugar transferase [Pseudoalteromonas gelatinilytica]|uniref:Glycosyltransferase n=1 Tax=Pseudoalteromonas gelatinilytica TaxID=1703256 RepID=A0A3A3ENR6_9GAMM|nr:sugar transferase [Pseudoalteromonas profundi]RJF36847.1 glycosyltransferase [Pseudoalteromonas profundi]